MRRRSLVISLGLLVGCAGPVVPRTEPVAPSGGQASMVAARADSATQTPTIDPSVHAQIEARNRELEQAYGSGDMMAVAAIYADDAVMLSPDGRRWEGRAEIDAYWMRFHEPLEWTLEVRTIEGNEGLVVERGRSTLVYRRLGGQESSQDAGELHRSVVEFMLVWVRQVPGDASSPWQITVDAYW